MLNRAVTRKGFTLMELLVVIAISTVLFGLLMYPLIKTFSLTSTASTLVDAQDSARHAIQQISRDIGEAMFVYDSVDTNSASTTYGMAAVILPVRMNDGSITTVMLPDSRLDMIPPQMIVHCNYPLHGNGPRDFSRRDETGKQVFAWRTCAVCGSSDIEIRPNLPLKHDTVIIRYFLGLKDNNPSKGWKPYDLACKSPGDPNPVVLYRVEFDPNDTTLFPGTWTSEAKRTVYNDPRFFYDSNAAADGRPFWQHWKEMAAPVASARYQDLVTCGFTNAGEPMGVSPTVSMRFAGIENIDFKASGSTTAGAYGIYEPPTVFRAPDGYWVSAFGVASPPTFSVSLFKTNGSMAYSTRMDSGTGDMWVLRYTILGGNWQAPVPVFNISAYMNDGSIVGPAAGVPPEMAYTIDREKGLADFAITPELDDSGESISSLDPVVVNNDPDRRALLKTYDSASGNYLGPNASIIADTLRVQVPDGVDSTGKPIYIRYLRTDEGSFKPGRNQFWLESPDHIRFSSDLPVYSRPGGNFPVLVDYQVQYNGLGDAVRGSYATKSRIEITIGMRVYDPDSRRPSNFALRETTLVGNALR